MQDGCVGDPAPGAEPDEERDIGLGCANRGQRPERAGERRVSQIAELHERGIVLSLDSEAAKNLPEPAEAPAAIAVGPDDVVPDRLSDKLRRAWRLISGKR